MVLEILTLTRPPVRDRLRRTAAMTSSRLGHAVLVGTSGLLTACSDDSCTSQDKARRVWNQHAYGITNVNDDLSIPTTQVPDFEHTNTWHSAIAMMGQEPALDLEAEILDVCLDECDSDTILLSWRLRTPS